MTTVVREPSRSHAPWLAPTALLAAAAALVVIHAGDPASPTGDWTYVAATLVPGVAALLAWRLRKGEVRRAWRWIALGVLLSGLGDLLYQLTYLVTGELPAVSLADLGWMGSYVALGLGMVELLRREDDRRLPDADVLLDVGTVVILALLVVWQLALADTIADTSVAVWERLVWSAYPVFDAILIALGVRLLLSRRSRTPAVALLLAGVGLWLGADFASMRNDGSVWLDTGWMLGAGCMGAAVVLMCMRPSRPATRSMARHEIGAWRLVFSITAMTVPVALELTSHRDDIPLHPTLVFGTTVLLGVLMFTRAYRLLREMRVAESRVRSSEAYYRAIAANSSDAVIVVDEHGEVVSDSENLGVLVGSDLDSAVGATLMEIAWLAEPADARALFAEALRSPGETLELEVKLHHRTDAERWLVARVVNLLGDPAVAGVVITLHDITDRKIAEETLEHQAFHDTLTGLANRALFRDRVEHAVRLSARSDERPAVLYLDLDEFKRVNDTLGHDVGDRLLRQVAARLALVVRDGDTVGRLGGDEFAILIEQSGDRSMDATATAERVLDALRVPVQLGPETITVSASIGIATAEPGSTAATLLRDADTAMYQAKGAGRGRWAVYAPEMRATALERLRIESDLPAAFERQQFRLAYQPIVELGSGRIRGFEALLRWDHPTLGPIPPDRFIPICEENGMIHRLGEWVLRTACQTAAGWQADGLTATISVNVSARQLSSVPIVELVRDVLRTTGVAAGKVVLEVTETALVDDQQMAAERLLELRDLGVRLAIDDFGTGYSSLSYLRHFPVDILKIDGSFVQSINDPDAVPPIIPGLMGLGRTLELEVIAEGIENGVQRDWLIAEGCELGQGYHFAAPMSPEDATRALRHGTMEPHPGAGLATRSASPLADD